MNVKTWATNDKIGEYLERKVTDSFLKEKMTTADEYIKNTKAIYPDTYYSEFCRRLLQMKQLAYPSNKRNSYALLSPLKNDEYEGLLVGDWGEIQNTVKESASLQDAIDKIMKKFNS